MLSELEPEITSTLTALENCIALLLPTPENFFIQESQKRGKDDESPFNCEVESTKNRAGPSNEMDSENIDFREHGIVSSQYSIVIDVNTGKCR